MTWEGADECVAPSPLVMVPVAWQPCVVVLAVGRMVVHCQWHPHVFDRSTFAHGRVCCFLWVLLLLLYCVCLMAYALRCKDKGKTLHVHTRATPTPTAHTRMPLMLLIHTTKHTQD